MFIVIVMTTHERVRIYMSQGGLTTKLSEAHHFTSDVIERDHWDKNNHVVEVGSPEYARLVLEELCT